SAAAAAGWRAGAAADPAGSIDVPGQRIPQFPGVPGVQVDLILGAVQPEADGTLGDAAVEVIDEQGLYLLSHGRPAPNECQRTSVCSLGWTDVEPCQDAEPLQICKRPGVAALGGRAGPDRHAVLTLPA